MDLTRVLVGTLFFVEALGGVAGEAYAADKARDEESGARKKKAEKIEKVYQADTYRKFGVGLLLGASRVNASGVSTDVALAYGLNLQYRAHENLVFEGFVQRTAIEESAGGVTAKAAFLPFGVGASAVVGNIFQVGLRTGLVHESGTVSGGGLNASSSEMEVAFGPRVAADVFVTDQVSLGVDLSYLHVLGEPVNYGIISGLGSVKLWF